LSVGLASVALAGCGGGGATDARRQLSDVTSDLGTAFAQARRQLVELAGLPEVRGNDPVKCHARTAQEVKPVAARYSAFGAAHRDGQLFCISIPGARVVNVSDRPYFQRAIRYRSFAVGDYQIGRVSGTQGLSVAYPVLDSSRRARGIVLASFYLRWLNRRIAEKARASGARVVVVDSRGTVLARSRAAAEKIGIATTDRRLLAAARSGGKALTSTTTHAIAPVPGTENLIWVGVRAPER
jgi:cache domain-containing protein